MKVILNIDGTFDGNVSNFSNLIEKEIHQIDPKYNILHRNIYSEKIREEINDGKSDYYNSLYKCVKYETEEIYKNQNDFIIVSGGVNSCILYENNPLENLFKEIIRDVTHKKLTVNIILVDYKDSSTKEERSHISKVSAIKRLASFYQNCNDVHNTRFTFVVDNRLLLSEDKEWFIEHIARIIIAIKGARTIYHNQRTLAQNVNLWLTRFINSYKNGFVNRIYLNWRSITDKRPPFIKTTNYTGGINRNENYD